MRGESPLWNRSMRDEFRKGFSAAQVRRIENAHENDVLGDIKRRMYETTKIELFILMI